MVMLNSSNITIPIIPIIRGMGFRVEPDWISTRDEVTDGYKRFYALVVRRIGKRGFAYLSIEGLAEDLCVCSRTISNYIRTSRELNLMEITPTGRSPRFVILWHPWMSISLEQAQKLSLNSNENFSNQTCKIFYNGSPQTKENQQVNSVLKSLETIVIDPIKDLRSMHAGDDQAYSNFADSENKQEEPSNNNPNTNSNNDPDDHKKEPLSQYDYEMCESFVIEYAKLKLATTDEIKDIRAFALYCYETGDKDTWIKLFIDNNYTLTPYNPIKEYQAKDEYPLQQPDKTDDQGKPSQTIEIKGKYAYEVYKDFAAQEAKRGKKIHSIEALATWLHQSGKQDNQVAKFIDEMKENSIGARANVSSTDNSASNNTSKSQSPELAQMIADLQRATAIESLGTTAWNSLNPQDKKVLLETALSKYEEKYPDSLPRIRPDVYKQHVLDLIVLKLGHLLFNLNINNLADLGKHLFNQLSDEQIAEFFDDGISNLELSGVEFYVSDHQQELLAIVQAQIEWELIVGRLVKML